MREHVLRIGVQRRVAAAKKDFLEAIDSVTLLFMRRDVMREQFGDNDPQRTKSPVQFAFIQDTSPADFDKNSMTEASGARNGVRGGGLA